jgi:hypothetical protein
MRNDKRPIWSQNEPKLTSARAGCIRTAEAKSAVKILKTETRLPGPASSAGNSNRCRENDVEVREDEAYLREIQIGAEPMLEVSDPLWNNLDDAHGVDHVPGILSELAASWDDEAARSHLFNDLCHQETCYGATYAAIPHLLKIAEPEENRQQRREIAFFLGFVALCARDRYQQGPGQLQGLPETLEGWDRKRDCYRSLVAMLEQPDRPRSEYDMTVNLPRYREILVMEPVNAADLEKIMSIKAGFFSALPAIRALCERALLENDDEEAAGSF